MQNNSAPVWIFPYCPAPPDWELDWSSIQQQFHWIRAMAGVMQEPLYHAEGDVLTHTCMVATALTRLDAWRTLPAQTRTHIFAAALLHDVGKPQCTRVGENGRISSRGHAGVGEHMARRILWTHTQIT